MNSTITLAAAAALTTIFAVQAAAQDASARDAAAENARERAPQANDAPAPTMKKDGDSGMMERMTDNGMTNGSGMMMDSDAITEEGRQAMSDMMKSCRRMMMAMSESGSEDHENGIRQ
ncbi:hypothetical protein [Euryhalocaulis caribicus]|uniref:hypothetical protein n=1 Tax=Euryhalocaulis caribicus TaxID=1161401 RepID=UPI00039BC2AC|nr:hypothetical protein [Euryhalocaulis caribicus]